MGLFGKGLLGLIAQEKRKQDFLNAVNDYNSRATWYECRYCGKKAQSLQRPSVRDCGKCPNSPYGTHYWDAR